MRSHALSNPRPSPTPGLPRARCDSSSPRTDGRASPACQRAAPPWPAPAVPPAQGGDRVPSLVLRVRNGRSDQTSHSAPSAAESLEFRRFSEVEKLPKAPIIQPWPLLPGTLASEVAAGSRGRLMQNGGVPPYGVYRKETKRNDALHHFVGGGTLG